MSNGFPNSPKLVKGTLAVYETDTAGSQPQIIIFQYNPNQLSRDLSLRSPSSAAGSVGNAREDIRRVGGPPIETINLSVELDATDQLEDPLNNELQAEYGLYPALCSMELLMYPASVRINEIETLAKKGEVQIKPANIPLTLLILDKSRVLPIFLTKFSITEQAFDRYLNPIRAKVDLGMRVLTYMELDQKSEGYKAFRSYQRVKEGLAEKHRSGQSQSPQFKPASARITGLIKGGQ